MAAASRISAILTTISNRRGGTKSDSPSERGTKASPDSISGFGSRLIMSHTKEALDIEVPAFEMTVAIENTNELLYQKADSGDVSLTFGT
jgi:hypothetical protein